MSWEINRTESGPYHADLTEPDLWLHAIAKWDGCVNLTIHDAPPVAGKSGEIHICDIDDFIKMLQALKAKAQEHFGEPWPNL